MSVLGGVYKALRRERSTSALLSVLDTGSPSEIGEAINELAGRLDQLRAPQRERLTQAARYGLASTEPVLRGHALRALGELREDPDVLEKGLADADGFARLMAVAAVTRAKPPIRIRAIERLRDDPDYLVREFVLAALNDHDPSGMPKPRPWEPRTWREWLRWDLAMIRKDLLRRNGSNFGLWTAGFAIVVGVIATLNNATPKEAIGASLMMSVGLAPMLWIRSWRRDHDRYAPLRIQFLEMGIAMAWAAAACIFLIALGFFSSGGPHVTLTNAD